MHHHVASRIKAIYDELEVIWNEAAQFKFVKSHLATCEKPGSNLCDELEAFGRESDRDVIVGRLVSESSNKRDVGVLVISVVGTGGIGKANLARIVFNDDMVKTHFRTSRNGYVYQILMILQGRVPLMCQSWIVCSNILGALCLGRNSCLSWMVYAFRMR